ncbi:MAG: oxidoreductase [Candidatus Xenobia bacterium]
MLEGKNILLTGGSRGLGPLIATALAERGANLALVARSREPLEEVAGRLRTMGARCVTRPTDLSDSGQLPGLVEEVERELGPVDILINNAGLEYTGRFTSRPPEEIEQLLATNVAAPMILTRLILPAMLERNQGHIVTIASLAGKIALPYAAVYSGSKAAVLAWSNSLRIELRRTGVRCSLVTPGYVLETGMFASHGATPPGYLKAVTPPQVVAGVLKALLENREEVVVSGRPFKPMQTAYAAAPRLLTALLDKIGLFDWFERTYDTEQAGLSKS